MAEVLNIFHWHKSTSGVLEELLGFGMAGRTLKLGCPEEAAMIDEKNIDKRSPVGERIVFLSSNWHRVEIFTIIEHLLEWRPAPSPEL